MKAEEVQANELFASGKQLLVPLWQRRYSWSRQQWLDLWSDIERLVESADLDSTHFLGSFVLSMQPWTGMPSESHKFLIIDGQQRMTTLTVLIAALRDEKASRFAEGPDQTSERDKLTRQLLRNTDLDDGHKERLVLQEPDDSQLKRIIDGPREDDGGPVAQAYDFFRSRVAQLETPQLDGFLSVILQRLTGVWVTLQETDNAHRVFQTLNAGGKPLRQADIVRNYFFLLLGELGDDFYRNHWERMERELDGAGLGRYLQAWAISQGYAGSTNHLFSYFQQDLAHIENDRSAILEYGAALTETADLYRTISGDISEGESRVADALTDLRDWGIETSAGVLLKLYRMRAAVTIESSHLATALDTIYSFLARRYVAGFEPNLHKSIFVNLASKIVANPEVTGQAVVELIQVALSTGSDVRTWPRDSMIRERCTSTPIYTSSRRKWAFSILERANREMFSNRRHSPPRFSSDQYSIEHIMPQSLTQEWIEDLMDWGVDNPADFHQSRLHVLGNLTLTPINPELSNKRFHEKKVAMEEDWLALNREVTSGDSWTQTRVDERSRMLAQHLLRALVAPLSSEEIAASRFGQTELEAEEATIDDDEDDEDND